LLRVVLLIACWAGAGCGLFRKSDETQTGAGSIWYFTVQSNLWVMLLTAIYLALSVVSQFTGSFARIRALEIARFATLVGITITFLVFWLLLAPKMEKDYLKSMNNLLVHTLAPLLFIADFFLFDRIAPLRITEVLWCMAMPLYYSALTFLHAAVNPKLEFPDGSRYPYFFMDTDKLGWFTVGKNPGVFWWILINLGLTLGLGYLYRFLLSVF